MNTANRIKNWVKISAINAGVLNPKVRGKRVLMYHGVDLHENQTFNKRFFSRENFKKQMLYFKKQYNVISLEDYFLNRNLQDDKLNIAITFDDGYRNNYLYAYPILEELKIPATFFVTGLNALNIKILWADYIEIASTFFQGGLTLYGRKFQRNTNGKFVELIEYIKKNPIGNSSLLTELYDVLAEKGGDFFSDPDLVDYWKLMTDTDIQSMSDAQYVKVGSHGFWHNDLGNIDLDSAKDEMANSKSYLENLLQYEVTSIGYPDGSYSKEVISEAEKLGFKYQCAVNYLYDNDKLDSRIIDRVGLYPVTSPYYINYQLSVL